MQFVKPIPFQEAIDKLGGRTPIGSALTAAEWRDVPVALRERAFFSSTVESLRFLQQGKDLLNDFLTNARDENGALSVGGRADFVKQLNEFAIAHGMGPVDPDHAGTIQDITSEARLNLIFDIQTTQAYSFGYYKQGLDPDVLDEWPGMRFIRVVDVKEPRTSHEQYEDQVFLKGDPIWTIINEDFGVPWSPFGFGCGHETEEADRAECEALGLLQPGEKVQVDQPDFNEGLQASARGIEPDLLAKMEEEFGDQIEIDGDTIKWKGIIDESAGTIGDSPSGWLDVNEEPDARRIGEAGQSLFEEIRSRDNGTALPPGMAEEAGASIASVVEGRKPLYHELIDPGTASDIARRLWGLNLPGVEVNLQDGNLYVYRSEVAQRIIDADPQAYPGHSLADKIHRATLAGTDGDLLGYGARTYNVADRVRVNIFDGTDPIYGFYTEREGAETVARERTVDFQRAYGREFSYRISE